MAISECYPLELHLIKALLLQRQYRQCIKACQELLRQTNSEECASLLHTTFAQFYLALAHDELARSMHPFSQAKVPAFNQAEQFYHQALTSLPEAEDCIPLKEQDSKPESRHDTPSEHTSSNSLSTFTHTRSQSDLGSIAMSPPTHIRNDSLPMRSPPMHSPGPSETDDLESHDSFGQIMTPTRLPKLERDYSSMSLLQPPQHPVHQGLMKPILLGSPAKPYFTTPSRANTLPARPTRHSMLPRIDTSPSASSPVRKQLRTVSEQASPIDFSPVSPLGSEGDTVASDAATISPVSPETPYADIQWGLSTHDQHVNSVHHHLQGMRAQLQSHVKLLKEAKQRTLVLQTEQLASRFSSAKGGRMASGSKGGKMQSTASYWSFTPEDQKVIEKQRRIEAGRERLWMRARFDRTRYVTLADAALAEL